MATPAQTIEGILERGHEKRQGEKQQLEHDEREAKLQTLVNSGLPPAQVQQGIRDIYGQDAPALQRHVENLFRRVTGKQPQGAQAPMRAADLASLEAQGTTPEQRQQANYRANTDYANQQGLAYDRQAAQQKQQQDFALIDQYVTDPEQNKAMKQAYVQRVAEGTSRPSADQQKRSDYQALVASGQVPKDAQGNPLSYEAWSAYSTSQGRVAGTPSVQKVGSFGEFVTSQFGPQPTPEQILKARSQWAQAGAGTTTGTHVIAVPQPDNTIKYYQVTTTSSKSFPGAGGVASTNTGTPAPRAEDSSQFMAVPNPKGLVSSGNIPIANRPVVRNADGSRSTEYSTSMHDDRDGSEVLVPTVVNGRFLTPDGKKPPEGSPAEKAMFQAAWKHYQDTGENLGKFDNPADADAYAKQLHNRQDRRTAQPAPWKQPSANPSAPPKATGIPRLTGDVTGGHPPPGFTKAQNDVTEATKLDSIAKQVEQHPENAANQKRLAVALERASAGRFTTQALDYITKLGWGNTIEQWASNMQTGALTPKLVRQLVEGAHENLRGAQDALDALKPGPAPKTDGRGGGKEHDPLGVL
jgi:hypothetical protein